MPVLINFKICDNAKECNGVAVCPTGTLSWNETRKTIVIDNSKCLSCGLCEQACMVGAIRVARNDEEYQKIKKEIDEDPRKVADLFVDRYGASTIEPAFLIPKGNFNLEVLESHKLTAVELFNDESIMCLLYSIPVKELFKDVDIKYRRLEIKNGSFLKEYDVRELPALLFFKSGKLIGKIEGYYHQERKEKLKERINTIISMAT